MQNLAALVPLYSYFCDDRTNAGREGPVTSALRSFMKTFRAIPVASGRGKGGKGNAGVFNPNALFAAVCSIAPRFKG